MKILGELTYTKVAQEIDPARAIVLIPVGSFEEHGPHMALMSDSIVAEGLARHAGAFLEERGYAVVIGPTIPFGVTARSMDYQGNITISPETLVSLVKDICRSLAHHRFGNIVLMNGHMDWEHVSALERARADLAEEIPSRVITAGFVTDADQVARTFAKGVREMLKSAEPAKESHSGESETSMLMYLAPHLVDEESRAVLKPATDYDQAEWKRGTKNIREVSPGGLGYFGSPALASREKGETITLTRARNLADEIVAALGPPGP